MFRRGIILTTDHPPVSGVRGAPRFPIGEAALVMAVAVTVAVLFYQAQFSGAVRWLLAVGSVSLLALVTWAQISRRTAEPPPLVGPLSPQAYREGELESFAAATRRAARGLPYSQVVVASRVRAAFLEHVRLALGLSPEDIREIQRDPVALRRILRDETLAEFAHLRIGDLEERYRWVLEARERGGFSSALADVLARVEAWR